ncbi:unnamed protein product [Oppiella nova]|uniref:Uncharacterized protein n=2 Tax=Oppiella nova TaxID=334625 RepID=A0A7R9MDA3_9ACAR|nr:unnamed protein product [Oppiella nova]CAG2175179.1 unnamed protein product [Oppiella nova]
MSSVVRFRRIRDDSHYIYLDIELDFESGDKTVPPIGVRQYKLMIMSSIRSLFGDFGAKLLVDLIQYRDRDFRAIIRSNAKDLVRIRNALIMPLDWEHRVCRFRIHKISHSLSSLAIDPIKPLILDNDV